MSDTDADEVIDYHPAALVDAAGLVVNVVLVHDEVDGDEDPRRFVPPEGHELVDLEPGALVDRGWRRAGGKWLEPEVGDVELPPLPAGVDVAAVVDAVQGEPANSPVRRLAEAVLGRSLDQVPAEPDEEPAG